MLTKHLQLAKYRFTLEAIDEIKLPPYKGSTFHGAFGHALMQISPTWYHYFYEPNRQGSWPKPLVILPPLDETEHYPIGFQFHCELTLIGEAVQHYAICQAAIEYMGLQMGLGYNKGCYKVVGIEQAMPQGHSIEAQEIIQTRVPSLSSHHATLIFPSRLRFKKDNHLVRKAPSFALFFERLIGRLKTLEMAYGNTDKQHLHDANHLLKDAQQIQTIDHNIHWDDWQRFSGRQKKWMKFGGLRGSISYQGDLEPFLPYLALGEWVHVGNKTSFGLGKYMIESIVQ